MDDTKHAVTIEHETNTLMPHGGHRASCSCGWWSDCYAMLADTQRAIVVHLQRVRSGNFDAILKRSSIGTALDDIKTRGIDAHLVDLESEMNKRWRSKKAGTKKTTQKSTTKLSVEDQAFMRGFGVALATIWRCHHDRQMIQHLIKQSDFTLTSFRGVGMLPADYAAIREAVRR